MSKRMIEGAKYLIYYGDLSRLILSSMAVIHAVIAVSFGAGLFLSVGARVSQSYKYLYELPGWPLSVGTIYLILGITILVARVRKNELQMVSCITFFLLSVTSGLYGCLFLAGSQQSNGIYGPQSIYLGFCTLYFLHSIFSFVEWLRERRGVHNVPVNLIPATTGTSNTSE